MRQTKILSSSRAYGKWSTLFCLTMSLLVQGCTERPSSQIAAVGQLIHDARLAGAQEYAVEQLQQAETSYRLALDELGNQDDRLEWQRSYTRVNTMLALAHSQAKQAKSEALANLEETKTNAQMALDLARDQIRESQALLIQPLSPYFVAQQFEELHRAVEGAEALLDTMDTSMMTGDYIHVMTSAHAVETLTLKIHQRILSILGQSPSPKVQV